MIKNPRLQSVIKAFLLVGLGFFLYSRFSNGTLYFYIAERFAWMTLLAVLGLLAVGFSYEVTVQRKAVDASHNHSGHEHSGHDHAGHDHTLRWSGVLLVAMPMILGLTVSPKPLGAAALTNREVTITDGRSALPAAVRAAAAKSSLDKNVLDWQQVIATTPNAAQSIAGEAANVTGFVFRDERFAADQFFVTRFTISCCVADAAAAGLVVRTENVDALEADQWVQVEGIFEPGSFNGEAYPILVAQRISPAEVPNQPYLYP